MVTDDGEHLPATVEIRAVDPASPVADRCLAEYHAELDDRFETGFDAGRTRWSPDEARPPRGVFLVASVWDEPVGCGALRLHDGEPAEIKRMWVAPKMRGLGVGRRLLAALEAEAVAHGVTAVRLDTNRALVEAISLYRSAGFTETAPFTDDPYAQLWFEKRLVTG
ncbi:MAG: GNAT family N-acetyltransferase [Acidimicrobiia bacterium]